MKFPSIIRNKMTRTPDVQSLIGAETRIEGNIRFTGSLRIEGQVLGHITANPDEESTLVVSENGSITGSVDVEHVIVHGCIDGPVRARELLELHPSAKVSGDVRYNSLEMHPGAVVEGTLQYDQTEEPAAPNNKIAFGTSSNLATSSATGF